jgi:hypothetical protein
MGYINLNPKDAAKFGCDERIELELTDIGVRQRSAVEKACKRSLRWMFDQLQGVPALDENNNPIPEPVLDDAGNPIMEDDGVTPKVTEKLTRDPEALAMLVYLALWGAGIRTDWDTFDVHEIGLEVHLADEDEASEGKDEAPETASESTTTA